MAILPSVRGLILCDYYTAVDKGKVDIYGILNAFTPEDGYPFEDASFCVYVQLANGYGDIEYFFDVRSATTGEVIHTTKVGRVHFADRTHRIDVVMPIESIVFEEAGLYFVSLVCNNT